MSFLEVNGLTIAYGGKRVVDDVSFVIDHSESVGLVGESGSGKSQTALALLGLLPKQADISGDIRVDGTSIIGAPQEHMNQIRARRIGIVFQDSMQALNPYLKIGKQLQQILLQHDLAAADDAQARVIEMFGRVGLPDPELQFHAFPHELSGGMRQRVMLAAALIAEPDLLIADEPTTALDVTVQAQILDLLEEIRDNTALLLITHDLGIVAGHCERMLVLEAGRLVDAGATTSLFASPGHAHTRALLAAAPRIDSGKGPEPVNSRTILSAEGVEVTYREGARNQLHAVNGVSLLLREGETLAVVGESGSGKSSFVRAVLGLVPMISGRVVFEGTQLEGPVQARPVAQRQGVQLIFQDPVGALNPQMRVYDIVGEPLSIHEPGLTAEVRRDRVSTMLKKVGLDDGHLSRYPHQISGGEAQRVAIARALMLEPKVLICDEAVAALDGTVREQVLALLRQVQIESGLSIIFISHDLAVVRSFSHRVAVMYMGSLVEVADNAQLFSKPHHPYTKALIDAVPVPDPIVAPKQASLQGEVGSLLHPPSGCVFHPRCNYAIDTCSAEQPQVITVGGSRVACHRAKELDLGNL